MMSSVISLYDFDDIQFTLVLRCVKPEGLACKIEASYFITQLAPVEHCGVVPLTRLAAWFVTDY